jgi:hypothetical protein
MTVYANGSLDRVPETTGGSVRVTIDSNAGQGNGGTSLPCKQVQIVAASGNSGNVRVRTGTACTASTGVPVPKFGTNNYMLIIDTDDVSNVYFYGSSDNDIVDILYRC